MTEKYYQLFGQYYLKEVEALENSPMWPQFDKVMRDSLLAAAALRAQAQAIQDTKEGE